MKRVLVSTFLLSTLLFHADLAMAQQVTRKTIDNFDQVDNSASGVSPCFAPDGMTVLPLPCLGLFVNGFVTDDASDETGLTQQNVTGGTRGTTLTYNAGPTTDRAQAAGLLVDPNTPGTLQIQNEQGVFADANLLWNGGGMGLSAFDASSFQNQLAYYDNLALGVYFVDVNTDITFIITNTSGQEARLTQNPARSIDSTIAEELLFSLTDPAWTNPGVFTTPIQSIVLRFTSDSTYDVNVDFFELQTNNPQPPSVPEPSFPWGVVILLGIGMISTYRQ